jgi:two-component system, sensor histidine kinase and response regulator
LLTGYRILVADDNTLNQKIATFLLGKDGAEVKIVSNGAEAVNAVREYPYDLILMDLQMPEMDGIEATIYIREVLKSNIPIIALSASNSEEETEKCMNAGMNGNIVKPIDLGKLHNLASILLKDKNIV